MTGPDARSHKLTWEDVRILREANLGVADIAERYVLADERRRNRWYRRLLRKVFA